MINASNITRQLEVILSSNLQGYKITRNESQNDDPNEASDGAGLINITNAGEDYETKTVGGNKPYMATIYLDVELQVVSMESAEDAEDKRETGKNEIMNVLVANKTINGTVAMTNGYKIKYSQVEDQGTYFQSAVITIETEVRAG